MIFMTDNLLLKIEERVLTLLAELELMRKEIVHLRRENIVLREDQGAHVKKLQGLMSLLDVLEGAQSPVLSIQEDVAVA
jgi:regulator of replication initiation timing